MGDTAAAARACSGPRGLGTPQDSALNRQVAVWRARTPARRQRASARCAGVEAGPRVCRPCMLWRGTRRRRSRPSLGARRPSVSTWFWALEREKPCGELSPRPQPALRRAARGLEARDKRPNSPSFRKSGISVSHSFRIESASPSWLKSASTYSASTSASASDLASGVRISSLLDLPPSQPGSVRCWPSPWPISPFSCSFLPGKKLPSPNTGRLHSSRGRGKPESNRPCRRRRAE